MDITSHGGQFYGQQHSLPSLNPGSETAAVLPGVEEDGCRPRHVLICAPPACGDGAVSAPQTAATSSSSSSISSAADAATSSHAPTPSRGRASAPPSGDTADAGRAAARLLHGLMLKLCQQEEQSPEPFDDVVDEEAPGGLGGLEQAAPPPAAGNTDLRRRYESTRLALLREDGALLQSYLSMQVRHSPGGRQPRSWAVPAALLFQAPPASTRPCPQPAAEAAAAAAAAHQISPHVPTRWFPPYPYMCVRVWLCFQDMGLSNEEIGRRLVDDWDMLATESKASALLALP